MFNNENFHNFRYETDLDSGFCVDRSHEIEEQIRAEMKAKNASSNYVNAFDESIHNYENTVFNQNQDDLDEIQTVHSEGVRSEAPPLPAKPQHMNQMNQNVNQMVQLGQHMNNQMSQDVNEMVQINQHADQIGANVNQMNSESSSEMYSLGDISEADERVKKFFGLLPKHQQMEIKTVRMVKRDSKERAVIRNQDLNPSNVPIPPRGNYQNVHDFLTGYHQQVTEESVNYNLKASTLPKSTDKEVLPHARSTISLAQYYHNKGKVRTSLQ